MRELNTAELDLVSGGVGMCTPANSYGGITDPGSFGRDVVNFYEGLVFATSHIIERVARAAKSF